MPVLVPWRLYSGHIILGPASLAIQVTMPLFTLAAGVAATVLTLYSCVSCCVSSYHDDDRQHRHLTRPRQHVTVASQPSRPTVRFPPPPTREILPFAASLQSRHLQSLPSTETPLAGLRVVSRNALGRPVRQWLPADLHPRFSPLRRLIRSRVLDPANANPFYADPR